MIYGREDSWQELFYWSPSHPMCTIVFFLYTTTHAMYFFKIVLNKTKLQAEYTFFFEMELVRVWEMERCEKNQMLQAVKHRLEEEEEEETEVGIKEGEEGPPAG